jgi:hypothetical protein
MLPDMSKRMTQEALTDALRPAFPIITSLFRQAAEEFETFDIPIDRRPVVDGAPVGIMMYALIWDRLERHFGRKGPVRMVETDGLKVLFFEELGIGVRVNKLDPLSFAGPISRDPRKLQNHRQLCFSFYDELPGHLIFGYTTRLDQRGVAVLDRVLLTLEGETGVQWWTFIDEEGQAVALPDEQTGPRPPVVRPKDLKDAPRKLDGAQEEEAG